MLRDIGRLRTSKVVNSFSPRDLPGLARWYDASDAATVTLSGSKVTQWNDKSSAGENAIQGTDANRYVYSAAAVNGLNAMTSAGPGQMTFTELDMTTTGWCAVIGGNTGASIMVAGTSNPNAYCGGFNSGSPGTVYAQDSSSFMESPAPGADDGSIHCYVFRNVATAASHFWDGVEVGTETFSLSNFAGGLTNYPDPFFNLNGTLCDVFIGVGELTNDHVAQITTYSRAKWGTP